MTFSLSKCPPRGALIHKAEPAVKNKNNKPTKPRANNHRTHKKRQRPNWKVPIPSFCQEDETELARMEREFLGEESPTPEKEEKTSRKRPPIPNFSLEDLSTDDDDDLFLQSILKKKKKVKGGSSQQGEQDKMHHPSQKDHPHASKPAAKPIPTETTILEHNKPAAPVQDTTPPSSRSSSVSAAEPLAEPPTKPAPAATILLASKDSVPSTSSSVSAAEPLVEPPAKPAPAATIPVVSKDSAPTTSPSVPVAEPLVELPATVEEEPIDDPATFDGNNDDDDDYEGVQDFSKEVVEKDLQNPITHKDESTTSNVRITTTSQPVAMTERRDNAVHIAASVELPVAAFEYPYSTVVDSNFEPPASELNFPSASCQVAPSDKNGHRKIKSIAAGPSEVVPTKPDKEGDLFQQVDSLYEDSDKQAMTVKTFCKVLEQKLRRKLDKATKRIVRGRLEALANDQVQLTITKQPTESAPLGAAAKPSSTNPVLDESDLQKENQDPQSAGTLPGDASSQSKSSTIEMCTNKQTATRTRTRTRTRKNGKEGPPKKRKVDALDLELNYPNDQTKDEIPKQFLDTTSIVTIRAPKMKNSKDDLATPATLEEGPKSVVQSDAVAPKPKGKNATKSSKAAKSTIVDITGTDDEVELGEVLKPNEPKLPSKASIDRRKRGRPPKGTEEAENGKQSSKETANESTTTKDAAPQRAKKRCRKGKCALCTTCSCQQVKNNESTASLDLKTFARSDAAVEKALIRRIQKLEKSSENMEEQTEIVKRQLKKHRREMWKKKEQTLSARVTEKPRFLPDAEMFEAPQMQSRLLPKDAVQNAQQLMFGQVSTYQPTLTQLMGCSSTKDKSKKSLNGKESQAALEKIVEEPESDFEDDTPFDDSSVDKGSSVEYAVPEAVYDDKVNRIEWSNGILKRVQNETGAKSSTIWGAVAAMPKIAEEENIYDSSIPVELLSQAKHGRSFGCSWDHMFADGEDMEEDGIDHLAGLFEGDCEAPPASPAHRAIDSSQDNVVTLSMLSQRGQSKARDVESLVFVDKKKLSAIQRACPNWRENVTFAMYQKDKNCVLEALENIKKSRERMLDTKRKILEAWERQQLAIGVFEAALTASLNRLEKQDESDTTQPALNGGFLTALSQEQEGGANEDLSMAENSLSPGRCRIEADHTMDMESSCQDAGLLLSY